MYLHLLNFCESICEYWTSDLYILIIYVVYYLITIQLYKDCPPKEK